jgi:hypothetical protein
VREKSNTVAIQRKERDVGRKIGMNMWPMATKTKMIENSPFPGDNTGDHEDDDEDQI